MNNLDAVLAEVWDETAIQSAQSAFNVPVLEKIARRKAASELGFGAVLAIAVWSIALLLGPMVTQTLIQSESLFTRDPILIASGLIAAALALPVLIQHRARLFGWMHGRFMLPKG